MKVKISMLLFVFALFSSALFAQTKVSVTGTVTGNDGLPLPGVSVVIKGTTHGVSTDFDGKYEIQAAGNEVLEFSSLGYTSQSKKVDKSSGKLTLNVVLKEEAQQLGEVVVTALGIKRQEKALSYNVQQVKSEELTKVKDVNVVNSLNGKVAGVNIQRSSSGVGGSTKVVMRGLKSIDGNNGVLYVIDGVPMFNKQNDTGGKNFGAPGGGEGISDFNPEDIESINVLTGPSAAALYGSEAANGVILINTKKGKEGKTEVSISSSVEMMTPILLPEFQNTYGSNGDKSWGAKLSTPSNVEPRKFFNVGHNTMNSVTFSTGNAQNQTFVSAAQTEAEGLIPNNAYYRYNVGVRNTAKFAKDKLHLDVSGNFIRQGNRNMIAGGGYFNPLVGLYLMPRSLDFNDVRAFERYNPDRKISEQYLPWGEKMDSYFKENPYWVANRELFTNNKKRYMMSASLKYEILEWLNVSGRVRLDNDYGTAEKKLYASTINNFIGWVPEYGPYNKGRYGIVESKDEQTYADIMLNINKHFGEKFSLTANVGSSYNDRYSTSLGVENYLFRTPNLFSINNFNPQVGGARPTYSRAKNVAVFASAELGYKGMLYLSATGRNDWSSQLVNSAEPSFFYPSVGLSGVISEMVKLPKFINYLKVRGSYTEVGSPISKTGLTPGTITHELSGGNLKANKVYPYPDFKAERTASWEAGVNARLFDSSLSVDLTLYKSNTYNQFFEQKLSSSSAYEKFYLQAGDVENRGVELAVSYNKEFFNKQLNWNTTLTYSRNINEIKKLVRDYRNPFTGEIINQSEVRLTDGPVLREGGSMSDITVKGVLARDANGDLIPEGGLYKVDKSQEVTIGKSTPDFQMGWRNSLSYKNIDLSFLFNGSFGGIVLAGTLPHLNAYGVSKASADARDAGGVLVNGKRYSPEKYYNTIKDLPGYYSYDATNVRLQEVSLTYTLNGKQFWDKVQSVTFGVIGTNLWMIYNKAPFDPQQTYGVGTYAATEFFMTPSAATYGASLKVKF